MRTDVYCNPYMGTWTHTHINVIQAWITVRMEWADCMKQYIDEKLFSLISTCTDINSVAREGQNINTPSAEIHFLWNVHIHANKHKYLQQRDLFHWITLDNFNVIRCRLRIMHRRELPIYTLHCCTLCCVLMSFLCHKRIITLYQHVHCYIPAFWQLTPNAGRFYWRQWHR